MRTINVLGLDYGASNGRGVVGGFDGSRLKLESVHHFPNQSIPVFHNHYWDPLFMYRQAVTAIQKAGQAGYLLRSLAIDTWALDFGLLSPGGHLLDGVHTYRDTRTTGMVDKVREILPDQELFEITGLPPVELSTLYQLLSVRQSDPDLLGLANRLLFMPSLIAWLLTGSESCDATIASPSRMFDLNRRDWSDKILDQLKLPPILPAILPHGAEIGTIHAELARQEKIGRIPVFSIAHHDTASAFASVPAPDPSRVLIISCGTWSIVGCMIDKPLTAPEVLRQGFCNEMGYRDQVFLARNLTGLFVLQECIREWEFENYTMDYQQLTAAARQSRFDTVIDLDDPELARPGNMNSKIDLHCRNRRLSPPTDEVEIFVSIILGLTAKYRETLEQLERITGLRYGRIHLVGGGACNVYLCEQLARETGRSVLAGPAEATAIGNICAQLEALGEIRGHSEWVSLIESSFNLIHYS